MKIGRSKQKEVTHIIWRTGNAYTFKKKYRITGLSSLPPSYYFFFFHYYSVFDSMYLVVSFEETTLANFNSIRNSICLLDSCL